MAKDKKKGPKAPKVKANVFKVVGAKSLKKTKAKAVTLGLKNIKQKVVDIDKQFLDIKKDPKLDSKKHKNEIKPPQKKEVKKVTKEDIASTVDDIIKMDL